MVLRGITDSTIERHGSAPYRVKGFGFQETNIGQYRLDVLWIEQLMQSEAGIQKSPNLNDLVSKIQDLPPLPDVVAKAMEITMDPDSSVRDLQALIAKDQALSAKILRIVNSAAYGLRREVSTVSHAIAVLGMDAVSSVIMAASLEGTFQSAKSLGARLLSDHSWGAALAARSIAKRVGYESPEEALVCGLMHDIGKPILLRNYPAHYDQIISDVYNGDQSFHEAELSLFGFSHANVGAMLAQKWNFPPQLAEGVEFHHDPLAAPNCCQLACIVNLANLFMILMGIGFEKSTIVDLAQQPASEYLNLRSTVLDALTTDIRIVVQAAIGIEK
jgi:putative nucleotidyltransferase with HDIG domain